MRRRFSKKTPPPPRHFRDTFHTQFIRKRAPCGNFEGGGGKGVPAGKPSPTPGQSGTVRLYPVGLLLVVFGGGANFFNQNPCPLQRMATSTTKRERIERMKPRGDELQKNNAAANRLPPLPMHAAQNLSIWGPFPKSIWGSFLECRKMDEYTAPFWSSCRQPGLCMAEALGSLHHP